MIPTSFVAHERFTSSIIIFKGCVAASEEWTLELYTLSATSVVIVRAVDSRDALQAQVVLS